MVFQSVLNLATRIGVGVERSAGGDEDNPLTDLVEAVGERFGPVAGGIVGGAFDLMIDVLGPDLLADVPPIVLPPNFDIDNGRADTASVELPVGPYILDIGTTENVGNGEFSRVVLGFVDGDGDDNDAEQILSEIISGKSGANLDFERVPGIEGVELVDISLKDYALGIEDGGATDVLTLGGPGIAAVLTKLDAPANLADRQNELSLVDVGVEDVTLGRRWINPIYDLVGRELDSAQDVQALFDAASSGDERIELVGYDATRVSLFIHNDVRGTSDLFVLFGDVVEDALGAPSLLEAEAGSTSPVAFASSEPDLF